MIVNRDRERLFGDVLADDILIERTPDFRRLGHPNVDDCRRIFVQFLVEDAFADVDAAVANVDARAGDQFAHLGVALAAETSTL